MLKFFNKIVMKHILSFDTYTKVFLYASPRTRF